MLEAVVNISEGRDRRRLTAIGAGAGRALLDAHSDHDHHRSVFTIAASDPGGTEAATRRLVEVALVDLDLREHEGVHPRLGVVDVVPFVALTPTPPDVAVAAAHAFGDWLARVHRVPVFFYGAASVGGRTLPEIRRDAFSVTAPDRGPSVADPRLGATAVGARPPLVAVNVELDTADLGLARRIARETRERDGGLLGVRALASRSASRGTVQVSMNLVDLGRDRDRARVLGGTRPGAHPRRTCDRGGARRTPAGGRAGPLF